MKEASPITGFNGVYNRSVLGFLYYSLNEFIHSKNEHLVCLGIMPAAKDTWQTQ